MTEYTIAPACWPEDKEDALRLLAHYGQHLIVSHFEAAGMCVAGYEAELRRLPGKYGEQDADLLLARVGTQTAGCGAVTVRVLNDGSRAAELKRLWVEPEFRGRGLGRGLVVAALDWARARRCSAMVLDTVAAAMPEASALYRSMGFQQTSRFNENPIAGVEFYILRLTGDK